MTPDAKLYAWLTGDALVVAPKLLGYELVSTIGGTETGGIIVESEAYHGLTDPASHAYRGRTPRVEPMFQAGGAIYVYFTYGMHYCVNVVTGPAGDAQAVLIRALEPTRGISLMSRRRHQAGPASLTNGPAKLAQALGITTTQSGQRLGKDLYLRPPQTPISPSDIAVTTRIGITKARDNPWRYILKSSHNLSRKYP